MKISNSKLITKCNGSDNIKKIEKLYYVAKIFERNSSQNQLTRSILESN